MSQSEDALGVGFVGEVALSTLVITSIEPVACFGDFYRDVVRQRDNLFVTLPQYGRFAAVDTVTLFRPTGETELALIRENGWKEFPPRLPEQPIFYPVLNEEYAVQIARDWNTRDGGIGYVLRFAVEGDYLSRIPVKTVGARIHQEYWIPAEELDEFNRHIVGLIEVVKTFEGLAADIESRE